MNNWRNAKDRYFKYFAAFYYAGILTYNRKTGRFTNAITGHTYVPKKSGSGRVQIHMYIRYRGRKKQLTILAYRLAWKLFKGPLGEEDQINHKDGHKGNDRLGNMEKTDNAGNQKHAYATGLRRRSPGELNPSAFLTNSQVLRIRKMLAKRIPQKQIARKFKTSIATVSNIKVGRSWSTVK